MINFRLYDVDMEFEIKNIDDIPYANDKEIIETIKRKGCLAPSRKPKESISPSQEIGTFLLEIINGYELIKKTILCNYLKLSHREKENWENEDKMLKDKFKDDYVSYMHEREKIDKKIKDACYSILETLLDDLEKQNSKLSIFRECALEYMDEYYTHYIDNLKDLTKVVIGFERAKDKSKKEMSSYQHFKKELQEKDTVDYMLKRLEESVTNFINDFQKGKKLIDNSFIHSEETRNNKFSGIQATLPTTKIDYKLDGFKCATPYKYTYEIKNVIDLFNVTIYQLTLNRKVIIKCKNCGKYLIPDRTDRQYCNSDCKGRYMTRKSRENSSMAYEYYRKLYNRYKNTKTYKEDFEKLKTIYYNQYRTKQIDDETFMNILLDFENKVKTNYTVKRGRPKKQ